MNRFLRTALFAITPAVAVLSVAEPVATPANVDTPSADTRALFASSLRRSMKEVPIEYHPGTPRFMVGATLENTPVRLQVDSGARYTSVSEGVAEALKLEVRETDEELHSIATVSKRRVTSVKSLLIVDGIPFPSGSVSVEKLSSASGPNDGLLGADMLRTSHAVLDFDSHRMFLRTAAEGAEIAAAAHAAGMEGFPLKAFKNVFVLAVNVNGRPARFIIDSGAEVSLLDTDSAKRLEVPVRSGVTHYQGVNGSPVSGGVTSLDEVSVGKVRIRNVPAAVMGMHFPEGSRVDGALGIDFLLASRAALDAGAERIYLSPGETGVASYSRLGGLLFDSDAGLKHAWASASWIGWVKIRSTEIEDTEVVERGGKKWRRIRVGLEMMKTFKGTGFPYGYIRSVIVLMPDSESWRLGEYVHAVSDVNPDRICFFDPRNTWEAPLPLPEGLPILGDLAAEQIGRVVGVDTRAK